MSQGDVLGLRLGETVESVRTKGNRWKVNETDALWLPQMHAYLVEIAKARQTITYGQMKADLEMPHVPNGMGRLLDLLSEACVDRRGEPSLAALVVNQDTSEVGADFAGDPVAEREACFTRWG